MVTHLVSDFSFPQLADFLSTPSYIIVQSLTQSLELHVWSSSSGNNCHAVQRSLPVHKSMSVSWAFTLSHFVSQICLHDFFRLLAIGMCHFLPVHHFRMVCLAGSPVNIQKVYISNNLILEKSKLFGVYDIFGQRNLRVAGLLNRIEDCRLPKQNLCSQLREGHVKKVDKQNPGKPWNSFRLLVNLSKKSKSGRKINRM